MKAVFLTSGELGIKNLAREEVWRIRETEAQQAGAILGINEFFFLRGTDGAQSGEVAKAATALAPLLKQVKPELIYLPHSSEWHPDHKAALPILSQGLLESGLGTTKLRCYEIWTPISEYQVAEDISAVMSRKLRAIRAHGSQLEQWAYADAIRGLNRYRGIMAGKGRYAEVFREMTIT